MIQYRNKKWLLWDKAGTKILGRHPSKQAAEAQETAIALSKARANGDDVPPSLKNK